MCQEPTELLWIGCLTGLTWTPRFKSGTSTPKTNSQTFWPKVISHTWRMERSSSFVQHQPFQLTLRLSESQFEQLRQNGGEEDPRTKGRRLDCGEIEDHSNEPDFNCLDEFDLRESSDCVRKPGDSQSIKRETWREGKQKFKTRRSVEFSRCILWRIDGQSHGETCRNRRRSQGMWTFPNLVKKWLGDPLRMKQLWETICLQWIRLPRKSKSWMKSMATPPTHISSHSSPNGSSLLDCQGNL